MLNLLPEEQREKIKKEYKIRRLVVASFFIFISLVIASVSLLPPYLISKEKLDESNKHLNTFSNSPIIKKSQDLSSETDAINGKIKSLSVSNSVYIYDILNKILDKKTDQISIKNFVYLKKDNNNVSVTLSGLANSRESLIGFEKNLQNETYFSSVDFPVSNLAKDTNIDFSIQIGIKI